MVQHTDNMKELLKDLKQREFEIDLADQFHQETLEKLIELRNTLDQKISEWEIRYKVF